MASAFEKPTALIVDDETLLRLHAADLLEDEGFSVLEAATAEEALELLAASPDVKLLFTDIEMPGQLNGLDLARRVHERWPHILLIVTSGRLRPDRGEIPEPGRFVAKPYRDEELLGQVNDLLHVENASI